jgi:AcrR family transcriptional regulator
MAKAKGNHRVSYHHGDLRRALVETALAALDRDGALPSWRALARECGVSQSAPYRHFESAEALSNAVSAEGFRQLAAEIRRAKARHADPRESFEAGFRAYVRFGTTRKSLYEVMFAQRIEPNSGEAADAASDAYSTLVDAVEACGVKDPLPVSLVLWTTHHGLVEILRRGLTAPGMADAEPLVARAADMMLRYMDGVSHVRSATSRSGRTRA